MRYGAESEVSFLILLPSVEKLNPYTETVRLSCPAPTGQAVEASRNKVLKARTPGVLGTPKTTGC